MAKVETSQSSSSYVKLYHWDLVGTDSLLLYWYIGPLGLKPDRLARFGLPRSSVDTWVDTHGYLKYAKF